MTLWAARMGAGPAPEMMAFTESIGVDRALALEDCEGSAAHVRGLGRAGILGESDVAALLAALATVRDELASTSFVFEESDEDIHTAIERRVTELAGETGARLHTGRSRNDQVVTALRLWTKRHVGALAAQVLDLQDVLVERATGAGDAYLPGYTHLQRAQPVPLAHHLLAHAWALARDVDRLIDARERLDVSPLGAGALAGSSLPLDPSSTAADLGFARPFDNSLDAVSDRDFVAEVLFCCALTGVHLSRLGEEIVLFSSAEVGFYRLDDAWATGSSMLPQKKNPDVAELARGKAGRLIGDLAGFLATLKGLPLAYNRDLQEDKEPLFDAVGQLRLALDALAGLMATVHFDTDAMRQAASDPSLCAVDLADWQVARGTPFRAAHALVGTLVRQAAASGRPLGELVAEHPELGPQAAAIVGAGAPAMRERSPGGAGPSSVRVQLESLAKRIAADRKRVALET